MRKFKIHAYIIPSTDAHQSEYVPSFWQRRAWISGFTGSAGDVIVTAAKAALWTDGRYFIQAEQQLAGSGIALMKMGLAGVPSMTVWLGKNLKRGQRVAVDARLLPVSSYQRLRADLEEVGLELVGLRENLVDMLWADRPAAPDGPIEIHPVNYAGERFQDKLRRLRKAMGEAGMRGHVIGALDQIAWLFNIRGSDVQHNPMVIAYSIVTDKDAFLFVDLHKVTPELRRVFGKSVTLFDYSRFDTVLARLAKSHSPWWIDPNSTSHWIACQLDRARKPLLKASPIMGFKAVKNAAELRGMKAAHVRDGAAVVRFLCWLDENLGKIKITEISCAERLDEFRARNRAYRGPSFDTIAGYAEHGAIIHYSATPESDVPLRKKGLLVLDSGGQYADGTTDITRTIHLGHPTTEQRINFTRVLKGHIQLVLSKFPVGTAGRQLDTLARKPLWEGGLDYGHGTGHGVGAYLSVHEGPHSISPTRDTGVPLQPGMVCSNEPGYYKAGEYGIRTENLVYVVKAKGFSPESREFLGFENLTLCPIDCALIEPKMLTRAELSYLNAYHARVRKTLTPLLGKKEAAWLAKATRPIR